MNASHRRPRTDRGVLQLKILSIPAKQNAGVENTVNDRELRAESVLARGCCHAGGIDLPATVASVLTIMRLRSRSVAWSSIEQAMIEGQRASWEGRKQAP